MAEQLQLSKKEQEQIAKAIMVISNILFIKMDEGVTQPCIEGENVVNNENKKLVFTLTAQKKEVTNG